MKSNPFFQLLIALLLTCVLVHAQEAEQFSIATLNIDGLPKKILVFNVNEEGPGDEGTSRVGKYLLQRNYDFVCLQEDFNYHGVWSPWMEDTYKIDEWSGAVGIDLPGKKIDFLHAQNERFECDGLGACWRNNIMVTTAERVKWNDTFGKFSHAADELVTKGFRRYEATLPSGVQLVIYNMHMDAGSLPDEKEGKDSLDLAARQSEWQQLKEDVLAHLDNRPILILGDMNSYYSRDHIKSKFIDEIKATGKGIVSDVWVELAKKGEYPAPVDTIVYCERADNLLNGEALDKIIYINPTSGTKLKAVSYSYDMKGYTYNDRPLGDHYPLAATFEVVRSKTTAVDADILQSQSASQSNYYNFQGQPIDQPSTGLYIEQTGKNVQKRIVK